MATAFVAYQSLRLEGLGRQTFLNYVFLPPWPFLVQDLFWGLSFDPIGLLGAMMGALLSLINLYSRGLSGVKLRRIISRLRRSLAGPSWCHFGPSWGFIGGVMGGIFVA